MVLKLLVSGGCVVVGGSATDNDILNFLNQFFDSEAHIGIIKTVCFSPLGVAPIRSGWITLPAIPVPLFIVHHCQSCLGRLQIQRTYSYVGFVREATAIATFQFQYHIYIRLTE